MKTIVFSMKWARLKAKIQILNIIKSKNCICIFTVSKNGNKAVKYFLESDAQKLNKLKKIK